MRMQNARKLSEEASTKLLLPMMLLLLMVMILIMYLMWESENEITYRRKIMSHLKTVRQFLTEEDGMGTVEVILIIVENKVENLGCV